VQFTGTLFLDNNKPDVQSVVILWLNILTGSHSQEWAISNQLRNCLTDESIVDCATVKPYTSWKLGMWTKFTAV